jgi:hypothetical protein
MTPCFTGLLPSITNNYLFFLLNRNNKKSRYKGRKNAYSRTREKTYEFVEVVMEVPMIRERDVEQALVRHMRICGGLALKFISPGVDGVPDRICLWPGGRIAFAEVKRPGAKPRPLQIRRMAQLRELGFSVAVIDSPEAAERFAKSGGGADAYS